MKEKRLDAWLSNLGYCSRKEAKKLMKQYEVCINNKRVFNPSLKAKHNEITIEGEELDPEILTIIMYKPKGVICSHKDDGKLIYSLLPERFNLRNPQISTIGRLDRETSGVILLTDDGELSHNLTSPKKHITKIYEVELAHPLKGDETDIFASGELMLHGEEKPLQPAKLTKVTDTKVKLEIVEGRYHQVRRMFGAVGNRVVELHRTHFGEYSLEDLEEGEFLVLC
jgi:16S rRNA pseudouridine516 synthase